MCPLCASPSPLLSLRISLDAIHWQVNASLPTLENIRSAVNDIFHLIHEQFLVETVVARSSRTLRAKPFGCLLQACAMLRQSQKAHELYLLLREYNHGIRSEQYNWLIWSALYNERDVQYAEDLFREMETNRNLLHRGWPQADTYALMAQARIFRYGGMTELDNGMRSEYLDRLQSFISASNNVQAIAHLVSTAIEELQMILGHPHPFFH